MSSADLPCDATIRTAAAFHRLRGADMRQCAALAQSESLHARGGGARERTLSNIRKFSCRSDVHTVDIDDEAVDQALNASAIRAHDDDARIERWRGDGIEALLARTDLPKPFRNFLVRLADGDVNEHDTGRWLPRIAQMRAEGVLS